MPAILFPVLGLAAENSNDWQMEYPELVVTPSASKRLEMEALEEKKSQGEKFYPFITSGLYTLLSGTYLQSKGIPSDISTDKQDKIKAAQLTAMSVGTFWIGLGYYLGNFSHPYENGYKNISNLPNKTQSETLTKERLSEEHLMNARSLGKKLKWFSVASNFLASAMVASSTEITYAGAVGSIGMLISWAPVLFPSEWEKVGDRHLEYKKKIYGPLSDIRTDLGIFPAGQSFANGIIISASF